MRFYLLLGVALLAWCRTQAQAFEPGLLVRTNGDTLRGEIENDFWVEPPTFVRFRKGPSGPSELLKPRQVRWFRLTGGRYFRFEALPIDHAAETRLDRLPRGYNPNVQVDSVLAEVLLDGPAELLRVVRFSTTHYLVRRPGQPPLDLSERKYLHAAPNGNLLVRDGNNYRAQLEAYFGDCPAADLAAQTAPFTPDGLAAVAQAYNATCAPAGSPATSLVALARPMRRVALRAGVVAGARFGHIDEVTSKGQLHPFAGVYGEMYLPNRSIAAYGELSLSNGHGQATVGQVIDTPANGTTGNNYTLVYSSYTFRALLGSARLGLRYYTQLPNEERLFFGVGFEASRVFLTNYSITSGPDTTPRQDDLGLYSVPIPIPNASVGWSGRRLTASLDAQLDRSFRLGLAYRLTQNTDAARPPAGK